MKRIFIILTITIVSCVTINADNANTRIAKANHAYEQELYNDAHPHAILYYERALLLDPSNDDARFNLQYVRDKAQIHEDSGTSWLATWLHRRVSALSSNTWAVIASVTFLLMLACVVAYLFSTLVWVRKLGFFAAGTLLITLAVTLASAFYVHSLAVSHNEAIILAPTASLSTSPREPKDKSEVAFEVNAGYKVKIHDQVKVGNTLWLDVETTDGNRAWIRSTDIEKI